MLAIVTWTSLTAGSAAAAVSKLLSCWLVSAVVVPGGSVTPPTSWSVFPKSKKFLATRGEATVPTARAKSNSVVRTTTALVTREESAHPRMGSYTRCDQSRRPSAGAERRSKKKLTSTGIRVSATSSDASKEIVTVIEKGTKNLLMIPPTSAIGKKTATVVSVLDITALETSLAPFSAANRGGSPFWRWR